MGKITRQELNTSVVSDLQNGKEAKEEIVQARGTASTLNARIANVENDQEVDHDALVDVTNELVDARGGEYDLKTYLDTTKTATQNALNNVDNKIGILSELNTEEKSSTVGAINEINTQLSDTVIPSSFDVMGGVRDVFKPSLNIIKNNINTSLFNVGFITDTHYEKKGVNYEYAEYSISHTQNMAYLSDKLDVIISGGDNINSEELTRESMIKRASDFVDSLYDNVSCDTFILMGNHDDGSYYLHKENEIMQESDFAKYWGYNTTKYGEKRPVGKPYFYKDYPYKKIRVIGLNTVDIPIMSDVSGDLKYRRINTYGIRQEQFDWLISEALGTVPTGYHVVVFSHNPTFGWTSEKETYNNFDILTKVLDAFKSGSSLSISGNIEDFEVTINKPANTPITFAGCFFGHIHKDYTSLSPGGIRTISTQNSLVDNAIDINTTSEDAFDVITVDTSARKINLTRFGRGSSRTYTY